VRGVGPSLLRARQGALRGQMGAAQGTKMGDRSQGFDEPRVLRVSGHPACPPAHHPRRRRRRRSGRSATVSRSCGGRRSWSGSGCSGKRRQRSGPPGGAATGRVCRGLLARAIQEEGRDDDEEESGEWLEGTST